MSNTEHPETFTVSGLVDLLGINGVIVYGWSLLNGTHPFVFYIGETHWLAIFRMLDTLAPGAQYLLQVMVEFNCEVVDGERVFSIQFGYGIPDMGACMTPWQVVDTDEENPTGPFVLTGNPACPCWPTATITLNWPEP